MPGQQPSMAELWMAEHDRQLKMYGDAMAQRLGPPPGGKPVSDSQLVEKYNLRDPSVTPDMVAQMHASGASPEDITRALYPEREKAYTIGVVGQENQLKEADRLARLAGQQQAQQPTPAGQMPTGFLAGSLGPTAAGNPAMTANPAAMGTPAPAAGPPGAPPASLTSNQPSPSQPALQVTGRPAPPGQPKRQSQIEGYY